MIRRRTNGPQRWPMLAAACLLAVGAACENDADVAIPDSTELEAADPGAAMTADTVGDVTIHSYLGPSLNTGTYVIDSSTSLVVIDTGYRNGDPETFRAAVDALDKPIVKVMMTHDHSDHVGGLNTAFADAPVATTLAVAELIDAGDRDIEILDRAFTIDGINYLAEEFLDAEARAQMVITLPDHDAIFTGDLVFNETHLYLTPQLDRWISILEELRLDSPDKVYPGHGLPADPTVYAETITYIRTAQVNLAAASSGEEYTAAMLDAYPDWREPSLVDFYPRALLSQPSPATTEAG